MPSEYVTIYSYGSPVSYTFYAASAREITIYTANLTSGDPYLELYDSNDQLVASNDNIFLNKHASITYKVEARQEYRIVAKDANNGTAKYQLYIK